MNKITKKEYLEILKGNTNMPPNTIILKGVLDKVYIGDKLTKFTVKTRRETKKELYDEIPCRTFSKKISGYPFLKNGETILLVGQFKPNFYEVNNEVKVDHYVDPKLCRQLVDDKIIEYIEDLEDKKKESEEDLAFTDVFSRDTERSFQKEPLVEEELEEFEESTETFKIDFNDFE